MIQPGTNINWLQNERKNKRKGFITSVIIHLLLLIMFLFLGLYHKDPPDPEEGVLINFGTVEAAAGDIQPTTTNTETAPVEEEIVEETQPEEVTEEIVPENVEEVVPEEVVEETPPEEIVTQDTEEAPSIEETKEETEPVEKPVEEKPKEKPVEEVKEEKPKEEVKEQPKEVEPVEEKPKEKPVPEVKEEPKPEVDKRSLFSGSESNEDKKGSDGNQTGSGDQGAENGDPESNNYNGDKSYGLGNDGVGYALEGRSLLGIPPVKDQSQETGIVAVRIKVNRNGDVISANYTSKGSTTTDSHLIRLAEEAARKAKFNADSDALEEQFGTITFTFKLR